MASARDSAHHAVMASSAALRLRVAVSASCLCLALPVSAQSAASVVHRALDGAGVPIRNADVRLIPNPSTHPWRYTLLADSVGKLRQGGFGSGSLPGDVVFRKQSRERLAHRLAAAERHHTARSEAVLQRIEARAGQVVSARAEFHDARELQDVRSSEVARSTAPLWSNLGSLLPDWLGW